MSDLGTSNHGPVEPGKPVISSKFGSGSRKQFLGYVGGTLFVLIFAFVGFRLLNGSHAASSYVSLNADKGTVTSGASVQACSGASDGSCVKFGGTSSSGGCPSPVPSGVIWRGDGCGATIDQQWASVSDQIHCPASTSPGMFPDGRIGLETTGVAATSANGRAIHFFYAASDYPGCYEGRSELSQGNPTRSGEPSSWLLNQGNDEWFAWEAYFPASYPLTPTWNHSGSPWGGGMVQWHQAGGCNAPPFNMGVKGGTSAGNLFVFYNNSPNDCPVSGQQTEWDGGTGMPINHNQWYKFELHANFTTSQSGSFQVYADLNDGQGMKLRFSSPQIYTLYSNAQPSHVRVGLLNDSAWAASSNEDLYVAGYTVASSQSAAAANAYGSQGP